ncbi:hypothetical protein [Rickettsia asembonensis]|uniref:hypothetical protein n=1 Tax=Rickettsia asembonensis TaxID=1068590 RepID=UPI000A6A1419|nr:hypothetical protein [Rickettsia asembonensis]
MSFLQKQESKIKRDKSSFKKALFEKKLSNKKIFEIKVFLAWIPAFTGMTSRVF